MKKLFVIMVLSIFLSSCGAQDIARLLPGSPRSTQNPTQIPTQTLVPTSTVDYLATADNAQALAYSAQLTSDAANRLLVDATVEHERLQHSYSIMTQDAELATASAISLTQQSDGMTQTSLPTYLPMTQTKVVSQETYVAGQQFDQRTALAATLAAPTQLIAMERSRVAAEFAETNEKISIGLKVSAIAFMVVMTLFLLAKAFLMSMNAIRRDDIEDQDQSIPDLGEEELKRFSRDENSEGIVYLPTTVPCFLSQLIELADGVINRNMTLGFNAWQGTEVHKSLSAIRLFLQERKFARLVHNSDGRLDITASGETFLRETLTSGFPPPPFKCLPENGQ